MGCGCGVGKVGTRDEERVRIVESFGVFGLGEIERTEILEALDSSLWDWYTDCDGCTLVSECYWPNKYFPPCLRHDFDFMSSNDGGAANARFYRLQRAYGMGRFRASIRWIGVTTAWFGWYKWRNLIRRRCGGSGTA